MVRINLIEPKKLADQHLVAEYNEMLMLTAYIKKYPSLDGIPKKYCLGKGHMTFFKDKKGYLAKRHEALKREMIKRGFKPIKSLNITGKDWRPKKEEIDIIKRRLKQKLRKKPGFYRYYGEYKPVSFFISLLDE